MHLLCIWRLSIIIEGIRIFCCDAQLSVFLMTCWISVFLSESNMTDVFVCGWIGGATGVLVSHPLDTLRVLVQTTNTTLLGAANNLHYTEGILGFFKGLLSPLISVGCWKAIMFSASSATKSLLMHGSDTPTQTPPVWHSFAGGFAAGAAGLSVQTPIERIKITAQTVRVTVQARDHTLGNMWHMTPNLPLSQDCTFASRPCQSSPGPPGSVMALHELNIARSIWRTEGLGGLYRGALLNATLCPLAIGVWFGANEWGLRRVREWWQRPTTLCDEFICGALSGTLGWAINFPADKCKAIVQAGASTSKSDLELLRPHFRHQGMAFLWRGMFATLLRSVPQTGATIVAFSEAKRWIQ